LETDAQTPVTRLVCADCGDPIDGVAYATLHHRFDMRRNDWRRFCEACLLARRQTAWDVRRRWALQDGEPDPGDLDPRPLPKPRPCAVCARRVAYDYWWKYQDRITFICSSACNDAWRNLRRRVTHEPCTCAVCSATFTPTRRDARYCSDACRQRAYRARGRA